MYYYIQDGRTPLFQASKNGRVEVVQLLLQKHADVGISNEVHVLVHVQFLHVLSEFYSHVQEATI